jgi:cobalt/nickel transport system ATP-binding protein
LVELLNQLPITKIIATHDLELVSATCQRTVIMDRGKIAADDKTERILRDIPLLRAHGLAR